MTDRKVHPVNAVLHRSGSRASTNRLHHAYFPPTRDWISHSQHDDRRLSGTSSGQLVLLGLTQRTCQHIHQPDKCSRTRSDRSRSFRIQQSTRRSIIRNHPHHPRIPWNRGVQCPEISNECWHQIVMPLFVKGRNIKGCSHLRVCPLKIQKYSIVPDHHFTAQSNRIPPGPFSI